MQRMQLADAIRIMQRAQGPPEAPPKNTKISLLEALLPPGNFHLLIFPPPRILFPMSEKLTKTRLIRLYIEQNPGYTLTEAAKACGVSRAMVSIVRKNIALEEGLLAGSRSPAPALDTDDTSATQTFAEIIENVLAGKGRKITPQEQAQIYSGLATHPKAQPGTVISALNGLRALEASAQQTNDLGPGIPLTEEGKVHRLSLLLMAVGPSIAAKAWEKAYPTPAPETDIAQKASLSVLDPIPEGTHDEAPVASESSNSPAEGNPERGPSPMEESSGS